jgi:peptidase M28-like protein
MYPDEWQPTMEATADGRGSTIEAFSVSGEEGEAGSSLQEDVEALSQLRRRTTTAGERESAEWVAGRLRALGAEDIRIVTFRGQSTWAWAHGAHMLAGLAASWVRGRVGRLLGALVAVSYELDVSTRSHWLRRLLPGRTGYSVEARISSAVPARRTLVLVAHHDAAHTGLVWHPIASAANRRRSARTGRAYPSHAVPLIGLAAKSARSRLLRVPARALLAVSALLSGQAALSPTAPGANDNATGVAAVLELARRFAKKPLPGVDVAIVSPGGEEAGSVGMRAWMRDSGRSLERRSTLVVNLDAIGSGGHLVVSRREGLTGWFGSGDVDLSQRGARAAGLPAPRVVTFPNVTDAFVARQAGLRAVSILSYDDGWISNLHMPSDTAENVAWSTVDEAIALTEGMVEAWLAEPGPSAVDPA